VITGTIAVCTRDRAGLLAQCLACLDQQLAEPGQVEVLVVDNGSSDGTPALLETWSDGGGDRRAIHEPRAGLSRARNAALEASERDVVLFLDDDALAPPRWAAQHLDAYGRAEHTGSTGGPVGLEWPVGRPGWVTDTVVPWYSALELGDETGPFPTEHGPYGTNMTVHRKAALSVGGYDPKLGRGGRRLLSGEEPDLTRRLREAGWGITYVAGAAVVHQVSSDRLDRRWLLRRGWWQGRSNARVDLRAGRFPTPVDRLRGAKDELADAGRRARSWRRDDPDALAALALVLAHAATGAELARSAASGTAAATTPAVAGPGRRPRRAEP
jgi:glycosyltransferase involved in cell wall biosynthesis